MSKDTDSKNSLISADKPVRVEVQENSEGDCFIEIPPHMLAKLGWVEGDSIDLQPTDKGGFILKKIKP